MIEILIFAIGVWILVKLVRSVDGPLTSKHVSHWSFVLPVHGIESQNDDGRSRQEIICNCLRGDAVELVPELDNLADSNAVRVFTEDGEQLGYIQTASKITQQFRSGRHFRAWVEEVYEFPPGSTHHGIAIRLERV